MGYVAVVTNDYWEYDSQTYNFFLDDLNSRDFVVISEDGVKRENQPIIKFIEYLFDFAGNYYDGMVKDEDDKYTYEDNIYELTDYFNSNFSTDISEKSIKKAYKYAVENYFEYRYNYDDEIIEDILNIIFSNSNYDVRILRGQSQSEWCKVAINLNRFDETDIKYIQDMYFGYVYDCYILEDITDSLDDCVQIVEMPLSFYNNPEKFSEFCGYDIDEIIYYDDYINQ